MKDIYEATRAKTYHTVGFVFDETKKRVGLKRKTRPQWQAGKLNGVGGHVEDNETPQACMDREFKEEVEFRFKVKWTGFCTMRGEDWEVFCFWAVDNIAAMKATDDEAWEIVDVATLPSRTDLIENLPWLIAMALDNAQDNKPVYAYVEYGGQR